MRNARPWAGLLGVENTVVERVVFDEDEGGVIVGAAAAAAVRAVPAVPRACHGTGHTVGFDQTVAWLVTVCSKIFNGGRNQDLLIYSLLRSDPRPWLAA